MKLGNGQYSIKQVDNYNITLSEVRKRTKGDNIGEDFEYLIGYYGSITGVLNRVLELNLTRDEKAGVKELLQVIKETKSDIATKVMQICQDIQEGDDGK